MDGFAIWVNEECRSTEFFFVDFAHASFIDGNGSTVEMPPVLSPMCIPQFTNASWTYSFGFEECNIAPPIREWFDDRATPNDVSDDVEYFTYTAFLNFDSQISAELGYGNLKQLRPTMVKCRVPVNLQENSANGIVSITEDEYHPEDKTVNYKMSEFLKLNIYTGGVNLQPEWGTTALGVNSSVTLGEHIQLRVDNADEQVYNTFTRFR